MANHRSGGNDLGETKRTTECWMRTGEQGSWEGPLNTYPGFPPFNGGRDEEVDVAPSALGDVVPLFVKQKHKIKFNEPDCTIISKLI